MKECKLKKYITKQWSFLVAWVVFGIAQIIYIVWLWMPNIEKSISDWKVDPITVTTDLWKMFRALEVWFNNLFWFQSELYWNYATTATWDIISSWWAFTPWVWPVIVGMIVGWFLVVLAERQNKLWVKYSAKLLLISFIWWMIFSYGTRLAGGCTLNHLLWWVPMMNIHSLVAVIFMSLWGLSAFYLMSKMWLAKYFKHQEEIEYVKSENKKWTIDGITYDEKYNPYKNPMVWLGLTFLIAFVWVSVYGMLFSPEYLEHLKWENIKHFGKSIAHEWLAYVIIVMLAWIIAWFAMWKSGFGTECALIAWEAGSMIKRDEEKWKKLWLPNVTRTLFKWLLPLQWVAAMWVILSTFILITIYILWMKHGFSWDIKYELTAWVPIGWFLLGFGAVLLIGCEIRSYMRLGMLYLNTLIGFIWFAIWYLPFTIFFKEHTAFLENTAISKVLGIDPIYTLPELIAWNSHIWQIIVAFVWLLLMIFILYWSIKTGKKYLWIKNTSDFLWKNTQEIHDKYGSDK